MCRINKNVFLVYGRVHARIYNLNTRKLIPVYHDDIPEVQQLFGDPTADNRLSALLKKERIIVSKDDYDRCETIELLNTSIEIAWIEINTDCNFRCIHCYVDGETHFTEKKSITVNDFKLAVDKITAFGIRRLHIIGGEPLIHPDFWIMMEYALPRFEFSVLFTNGFLLDEEKIYRLKKLGLTEIDVSLYSTIEAEHEKVTRKKGSFSKALSVIRLIEKSGIICHIATVRVPGINIGEPYCSQSENAAVQHFDYMRASGRGAGKWSSQELIPGNKAITSSIIKRSVDPQKILYKMKYHNCFGKYIRVNPELNVYPCTMEQRICHGNIRENSISEIIKQDIRVLNKDKIKGCCVCEYRYICSDCRPDTFSEDLFEKPWFCKYDPFTGEWDE